MLKRTLVKTSLSTPKKPPDEIIVIAILKESNVLRLINFYEMNKNSVRNTYSIKILNDYDTKLDEECKNLDKQCKEFLDGIEEDKEKQDEL